MTRNIFDDKSAPTQVSIKYIDSLVQDLEKADLKKMNLEVLEQRANNILKLLQILEGKTENFQRAVDLFVPDISNAVHLFVPGASNAGNVVDYMPKNAPFEITLEPVQNLLIYKITNKLNLYLFQQQ